jgi:MFS family permease
LAAAGLAGLAAFIRWEGRVEHPVLDVNLFRGNPVFAFSNLAALVNYMATAGVGFLLSLFLQYIKGLPPRQAGLVLLCQPVVMALGSPLAGRLSDRVEPRVLASLGMALTAAGLVLLTFLGAATPLAAIVLVLLLLGAGFALFSSPNTNAVMSAVEKRYYGVASGTLGTMRLTGQMLSMAIVLLLFALHLGQAPITPDRFPQFLLSCRMAFGIFALLCFSGIFASLARGRVSR